MNKYVTTAIFSVSFAVSSIAGCTNKIMQPVSGTTASEVHVSIFVGDTVRVLTKHGDRQTFEVIEITKETLDGQEQSIRYDEMAFVEKWGRSQKNEDRIAGAVILMLVGGIVVGKTVGDIDVPRVYGSP